MRVVKHQTIEKSEEETLYKVHLEATTRPFAVKRLTIESEDRSLLDDYALEELVSIRVIKPQRKLA